MLRQTSKMAAGSEVVRSDRLLAVYIALISDRRTSMRRFRQPQRNWKRFRSLARSCSIDWRASSRVWTRRVRAGPFCGGRRTDTGRFPRRSTSNWPNTLRVRERPNRSTFYSRGRRPIHQRYSMSSMDLALVEPTVVSLALQAAFLIAHHNWRPGHALASNTAIRLDFGTEITQEEGLVALRALLVRCTGGDETVADALVSDFGHAPPRSARNALLLLPRDWAAKVAREMRAVPVAGMSVDPPEFSTLWEHQTECAFLRTSPTATHDGYSLEHWHY
ncbi:hypothetical protein BC828DRAFT_259956 [Blastocladiella britannica]|nr:hypothetical protein BC828DRAFT_259956 [Blastocladiella britannica]